MIFFSKRKRCLNQLSRFHLPFLGLVFIIFILPIFYSSLNAFADEFVFETKTIKYLVNSKGLSTSILEKSTGTDWVATKPTPFTYITKSGQTYPVTELTREGDLYVAKFGKSGVVGSYRILTNETHISIELVSLTGGEPDSIKLCSIQTKEFTNTGPFIAAQWNEQITVCLMALSERVRSQAIGKNKLVSTVYPQFGMVGEKVAFIAVPTPAFLDVVKGIEKEYNLPSPTIGGQWAKQSPDVDTNYLFVDFSEKTADQIIVYAILGGFKYVLVPWSSWASSRGSYPINKSNFPLGEKSLKTTIDKFHAAGIKVGMHMLNSLVDKHDPLVRPKPDSRLLKFASVTLDENIDANKKALIARDLAKTSSEMNSSANATLEPGADIQIDDEIIRCDAMKIWSTRYFLGECQRGHSGTKSKMHKADATIKRLAEGAGCYLADLRTSLKDQIADRVAAVVNQCGFDMIYFDGGELDRANGPAWYWIGQQQTAIWKRLKRDVLIQGSGMSHWLWHIISRMTCDDYAAIAVASYMDHHKLKRLKNYRDEFMPAELGWCGLLAGGDDHPATTVADIEHYGVRMIAFNAPISIQTNLKTLKVNKQTDDILKKLKQINELRCSGNVSEEQREKLKTGNWILFDVSDNVAVTPVQSEAIQPAIVCDQTEYQTINVKASSPGALLASKSDEDAILLFQGRKLLDHPVSEGSAFKSGKLICSVTFTDKIAAGADCRDPLDHSRNESPSTLQDLRDHQALVVTISVKDLRKDTQRPYPVRNIQVEDARHENKDLKKGIVEGSQPPYPVLNIQLGDSRSRFRDYYIDLNFTGERTIIIPHTNVERILSEFGAPQYNIKNSLRYFNYGGVKTLNFRWMRNPENPDILYTILSIKAFNVNK